MNSVPIIYENDDIYIINKPSGLATQGGQGIVHSVDTVLAKQVEKKIYLVHRLDKDTEGLLIVAKNAASASKWTDLISGKEIQKEYYAVCTGDFPKASGSITDSITHKGVTKQARTHFNVEKTESVSLEANEGTQTHNLNLVHLQLDTGRMHQIRIHLAKNGTPIAGDDKYGNFKLNKLLKKHLRIKRLQLAAIQLTIPKKHLGFLNNPDCEVITIPIPFDIQKSYK